jgi:capsular exopolysaccharide synthesis family protein
MSRLYEALQRADLDRKFAPGTVDQQLSDPVLNNIVEPSLVNNSSVLDNIPRHPWHPNPVSLPTLDDHGVGVEQFRRLRSRIYQLRDTEPLKTILVCSGMAGDGKSFVAANLAMSLARNSDHQVLLIDADQRRSSLHYLLGAPNVPGLSEYLAGNTELDEIVQRDSNPKNDEKNGPRGLSNLTFIPAGVCNNNSSEIVASRHFEDLVATLKPHFDWVIIDSPPVLAVTDAVDLARAADGVLLVARGAKTPYDVAQRTQAAFGGSRILGYVLNALKHVKGTGGDYYYYNYDRYDQLDSHHRKSAAKG